MAKKVSDEFLDYIVTSGKTKLTADELYSLFTENGYKDRCLNLHPDLSYWDDDRWKVYIYNYAKLIFGLKAMKDKSYASYVS